MNIAHVTFSGSLLSINFLFLRLAAGSMSAADTGGLLAVCPATGAGEGGRTPPEENTAVGLATTTLCFAGGLLCRLPEAAPAAAAAAAAVACVVAA
jgi:hypothetical protein